MKIGADSVTPVSRGRRVVAGFAIAGILTLLLLYWLVFHVLPLPPDFEGVIFWAMPGVVVSMGVISIRLMMVTQHLADHRERSVASGWILGRTSYMLIGWAAISWGAVATWAPIIPRGVSIVIGLVAVTFGHFRVERRCRAYLQTQNTDSRSITNASAIGIPKHSSGLDRGVRWKSLVALILSLGSIAMIQYIAMSLSITQPDPPSWAGTARIALFVGAAFIYALPWAWRLTSLADVLRGMGRSPLEYRFWCAASTAPAAPCLAFVLLVMGGSSIDIYILSALSLGSVCYWYWQTRRGL